MNSLQLFVPSKIPPLLNTNTTKTSLFDCHYFCIQVLPILVALLFLLLYLLTCYLQKLNGEI
jgi:hypothetical protein